MGGRFAGRRALVTGASRGIGAAIAEGLAAEGADVAIAARTEHAGGSRLAGSLEETSTRIRVHGTRVAALVVDLADPDSRSDLVTRAEAALGGGLDIVVSNAAAAIYAAPLDYPLRRRQLTFEVNVHAPLDLMQQAIPGMRERGAGWIVNVSSATARLRTGPPFDLTPPGPSMTVYGASKAALNRLSNGVAADVYGSGIRVNTVEPRFGVLTEGADALVGAVIPHERFEPMADMVQGTLALCDCPPELTGQVCVSLDLLAGEASHV